METTKEVDHAKQQAGAQLESIREMIAELTKADEQSQEAARQTIQEDPLSVQVRSGWYTPGEREQSPAEFKILLCTGGPACRIIGDLTEHGEPENPRIQYQDWYTPWTEYHMTEEEAADVLAYCQQFYFGE